MNEKEGVLRMQSSGRWAVCRLAEEPREIASGSPFRVEVYGTKELQLTRMEFRNLRRGGGEYFSVDDYRFAMACALQLASKNSSTPHANCAR